MKNVYRIYCCAEEIVCGFMFFSIVVLVFSSAFLRYVDRPLIWADDIAKLFFAWTAFLGADVAMRRCRLVGVDIIVIRLTPKLQKIAQLIGNVIIAIALFAFVHYGIKLSITSWERYFQTIPVSYSFITMSLPVGALCMLLTTVIKLFKVTSNFNNDAYSLVKESQEEEPENLERQVV